MTKIFLIECSAAFWIEIAEELQKQDIEIAYWTAWSKLSNEIKTHFPNTLFHDALDAKLANTPDGKRMSENSLDSACINVWNKEAQIVYDMMNRFDSTRDMSFLERSAIFLDQLVYWRQVLKDMSPDLVLFPAPPHVVYDYIILALCRELNIRTLMFEESTIYEPYYLVMSDYLEGDTALAQAVRQKHVISDDTMALVNRMRKNYAGARLQREIDAQESRELLTANGMKQLHRRRMQTKIRDIVYRGKPKKSIFNPDVANKEQGVPLRDSYKSSYANSRYADQLIEQAHEVQTLNSFYHANATPIEDLIGQPYIYAPLAGQPERTTSPQAEIFTNQILIMRMLASAIPESWKICVKEHPNQFHPVFSSTTSRDLNYYQTLLSIDKLHILDVNTNPFTIIDNAQMISTTGGTTGLESIARGVPCLLFGNSWYRDCPGAHRVRTVEDIQAVIEKNEPIDLDDFPNFLEAVARTCPKGLADYPRSDYPMPDDNVATLVSIITNYMK